jgi:hypothetical protein
MKTQVVRLDPHDDIISTRDKLGWKQTGRVLLVWPRKGRILTRRIDLVLLTRHSASLGAQLALVTSDPEVRANARNLGVSVFQNAEEAQRSRWERPYHWRRRISRTTRTLSDLETKRKAAHPEYPAWLKKPAVRLLFFAVGVLAVLAVMVVLLPGANISITPPVETQSLEVQVRASPDIEQINLSGMLPVQKEQVVVEGRDEIKVTGRINLPSAPAAGEVTFSNLTIESAAIPAGTIVRTLGENPIRFATTRAGQLPPAPGSLTLPVRALVPGAAGNLGPDRLTAIEGSLGLVARATNDAPLSGGTNQSIPSPTERDQVQLYERLLASLKSTALEEINSRRAPGDLLLTTDPDLSETLEKEFSPDAGTPAETLGLQLQAAFDFYLVPETTLEQFAQAVLDANLPEGFSSAGERIEIQHRTTPQAEPDGEIGWTIRLSRPIQMLPDTQNAAQMVSGLSRDEAFVVLSEKLEAAQPPVITVAPAWWPRLPFLPFRIQVQVVEPPT